MTSSGRKQSLSQWSLTLSVLSVCRRLVRADCWQTFWISSTRCKSVECPTAPAPSVSTATSSLNPDPDTVKLTSSTIAPRSTPAIATRTAAPQDSRSSMTLSTGASRLYPSSYSRIRFAALQSSAKGARLRLKSITSCGLKSGLQLTMTILFVFMTARTFAEPATPITAGRQPWRMPASGSNRASSRPRRQGGVAKISRNCPAPTAVQAHARVSQSDFLSRES